jgi:hypothetical protein
MQNKWMRLPTALMAAVILVLPALPATEANAQQAEFTGTFELVPTPAQARSQIDQEIDAAVEDMFFAFRGTARSRLQKSTEPCQQIGFDIMADEIIGYCDDRVPTISPADGNTSVHINNEGDEFVLAQQVVGSQLRQVFGADDGLRRNVYELGPDGETLTMRVTIEADRLPEPLTYSLTFERVSDRPPG